MNLEEYAIKIYPYALMTWQRELLLQYDIGNDEFDLKSGSKGKLLKQLVTEYEKNYGAINIRNFKGNENTKETNDGITQLSIFDFI